jgi:hypothetical protein
LPEPTVASRLVTTKPDLSQYIPYRVSTIEQEYRHESPVEILNTPLFDFVDMEKFKPKMNEYLAAEDEVLVKSVDTKDKDLKEGGQRGQRTEVTWLRRTEYLSTETKSIKNMPSLSNITPVPTQVKLENKEDVIQAIERSFVFSPNLETLQHPNNPSLKAVSMTPIFPSSGEPENFAQCTFDADPNTNSVDGMEISKEGDQSALVKAMSNANDPNDAFVWYYLPAAKEKDLFVYTRDYDIQRVDRHGTPYVILSIPLDAAKEPATYTPISGHFNFKKRRAKTDQSKQRHSLKVTRF